MDLSIAIEKLNQKFNPKTIIRPLDDWEGLSVFYDGKFDCQSENRLCLTDVSVWRWGQKEARIFDHIWITYPSAKVLKGDGRYGGGSGFVKRYYRRNGSMDFGIVPQPCATASNVVNYLNKNVSNFDEARVVLKFLIDEYEAKTLKIPPDNYDWFAKFIIECKDDLRQIEADDELNWQRKINSYGKRYPSKLSWIKLNKSA